MGISKIVLGDRTLIDLSSVTVTPETLGEGVTSFNANGELIVGSANLAVSEGNGTDNETGTGSINKVIFGGRTLIDLTAITATAETVLEGVVAINAKGELIVGTAVEVPATVSVSVYGAASETVTLTHESGDVFTATANSSSKYEVPLGSYTVSGNKSGYSKTVTVDANTTRINAWPEGATIYYWYGYAPNGGFASAKAVPSNAPYTSNPTGMQITASTNSVFLKTYGDYARGGTAYLPKTTVKGSTLYLVCSGTTNHGSAGAQLKLVVTSSISNKYSAAKQANIAAGATSVNTSVSSISGGSYYIGITGNTSNYDTGSKQTSTTVKALYSV